MKENSVEATPDTSPTDALAACLQWACNPRGGNNLYGRTLNGCGRQAKPGLGTLAVTLDRRGRYHFVWDPEWFAKQDKAFQLIGIFHEAGHLILQHLERQLKLKLDMNDDRKYARIKDLIYIAGDMAVNDVAIRPLISSSAAFAAHEKRLVWPEERQYPPGKSFETYLALLLKDLRDEGWDPDAEPEPQKIAVLTDGDSAGGGEGENDDKQPQSGSGDGDGGGENSDLPDWVLDLRSKANKHVDWEKDFDDMNDAEVERAISRANKEARKIVKTAVEQTQKNRGTIPGALGNIIEELLQEHTIPWQTVLMGLIKSEISSKLDESTSQPNPCYFHLMKDGIAPYPGYQHNFAFRMVLAADTSGSVSDSEFQDFMAEMQGLLREEDDVTAWLLMFDAGIQHEKVLEDGDTVSLREFATHRYGYGGTSFIPPLKYVVGEDTDADWEESSERANQRLMEPPDLVVMFTDGYAPVESPSGPIPDYLPPCPLIWVLTPSGQEHDLMQPRVLRIKD